MRKLMWVVYLICLILAVRAEAQDDRLTLRDPLSLAERYLAVSVEPQVLPITPLYRTGDRLDFWVGKGDAPVRVSATLASAAPFIYLWVEDGLEYDVGQMGLLAGQLSEIYDVLQLREHYAQPFVFPGTGEVSDPTARIHVPDVDNDPHLYVLFTTDLIEDREVVFNPNDSVPAAFVPGGYSNEHEILYVNTTVYPDVPLHNSLYFNLLVAALYPFVMSEANPTQAPWLSEALNLSLRYSLQQSTITAQEADAFLRSSATPLTRLPGVTNRAQTVSGQQMFLNYYVQRYGIPAYRDLFLQPGQGIAALDHALLQNGVIDPATGAEVTGRDAFADFVIANLINVPFGDRRYVHTITPTPQDGRAISTRVESLNADAITQTVDQFGTVYLHYIAQQPERVTFRFEGVETVARLSMPSDADPQETFYLSGGAPAQDTTMTRAFDLREVETATLTFDVWHDLANAWNYGYVSVSTDDGATWIPLPSVSDEQGTTHNNRHGVAYGPGFTGISNPEGSRPFPIIGVIIAQDGVTLGEITPGGPAAEAGLQQGDVIVGHDGEEWTGVPDILALLANYVPGDTVDFYIQRGNERMDVPVVLGAHPTRIVQPEPLWLAQTVDLTPFTGQEILLRFEYVSLPGRENGGFAVKHLSIPELDFTDDGEWMLNGWQAVTNTLPQQWLVQSVTSGSETTALRVRPLIGVGSVETSGEWTFSLQAGETLLVAISGLNDDTYQPATFSAAFSEGT